jgi:polyisoprenoid-binding protein YceI
MNPMNRAIYTADWTGAWRLVSDRTSLTFRSPTFWGLLKVTGSFSDVKGSGEATAADPGEGYVTGHLELATASVQTGVGKRDEHLRSADFFDSERYPTIAVAVDSVDVTGPATVDLHMRLTIKDVTHPLVLAADVTSLDDGALRVSTSARLNRREFGVDGNLLGMMGDTTTIEATAVFVKQS